MDLVLLNLLSQTMNNTTRNMEDFSHSVNFIGEKNLPASRKRDALGWNCF